MPLNDSNKKHGREFPLFPPYHITCLIKSDFQPKLIRLQANALPADNCSINRMSIEKSEKKTPVAFVSLMEMQLYSFFCPTGNSYNEYKNVFVQLFVLHLIEKYSIIFYLVRALLFIITTKKKNVFI